MAPHSQAATGKRKKAHEPGKSLAVKSTNPASKKARKQKKQRPAAEQDKTNAAAAAAAAADEPAGAGVLLSAALPPARQLEFLLRSFERAAKMRLSPLELGAYSEGCMVQLAEGASQDAESFGDHVKGAFGATWKGDLCEGKLVEGSVDAGSPALLVISLGALRSLELLRGLRMFTRGCHAVKLFAKHIKVEEQVALLKDRVNIACGTPSREVYFCIMVSLNKESHAETTAASAWSTVIGLLDSYLKYLVEHSNKWIKKLIDMEALSLSRLKLVVLDMQRDPKSFNLFTLPQVSNEFWDLFKGYLGEKVRGGNTRICFYGAVSEKDVNKVLPPAE